MIKKILSSSVFQGACIVVVGFCLLAALYVTPGLLTFYTVVCILSLVGISFLYIVEIDVGMEDSTVSIGMMILIGVAFFTGWNALGIYQSDQQQLAVQYQATEGAWLSNHTAIYMANVTSVKVFDTQSCNNFFVGGCSSVKNENITITASDGHTLISKYSCDYFTLGQQVKVQAAPKWPPNILASDVIGTTNSSYGYMTHMFDYKLLTPVPSGC